MSEASVEVIPTQPVSELRPAAAPFFSWRDRMAFLSAGSASFAGYFYTLQPSVGLEDSGEFITAAYHLGVPHPPGYPIWTILAWIWCHLVPLGNIAWRVNLMSAVFGAVAAGLVAMLISKTGHIMGARVGFLHEIDERVVNLIVLASSVSAALMLAFSPVMWSQSVIAEVYALNAFFLALTLLFLYRWSFEPARRWRLYLAAFVWGVSLTNHQTLVLLTIAFPAFVWFVDRKLGRDTLIPILSVTLLMVLKMIVTRKSMVQDGPFSAAVIIGVGIGAGVWLWHLLNNRDELMQRWKQVIAIYACVLVGLSLYAYNHLSSNTNPPMNWGYCSTSQGFVHHFTRGQYEKLQTDRPLIVPRPGDTRSFWGQLNMFFDDLQSQFNIVYALCALFVLFFYRDMDRRDRDWVKFLLIAFLFLGFGFIFLSNPSAEKQKQFTDRVFFLPGHVLYALWIGYGMILGLGYLLSQGRRLRLVVPVVCVAYILVRLLAVALYHWPLTSSDQLLIGFVAATGVLFTILHFKEWRWLVVAQVLVLFALPAVSFARNWVYNEQRNHYYGYEFGYLMFKPGGGYPEMDRDAILYGGTDPGRFVPTYMIFVESLAPSAAKTKLDKCPESSTFDRHDVYIITQNALADSTYMSYIRDHYDYSRPKNDSAIEHLLGRAQAYPKEPIWIPGDTDSQAAFSQYVQELQKRQPMQDEQVQVEGGKVQVQGVQGVMAINGILTRMIFDKNKDKHAFYVEESYQIQWMYPFLEPFGIIMKINKDEMPGPQQAPDLWNKIVLRDRAYWDKKYQQLKSDPVFHRDDVAQKTFSKLRSAIGGVYAFRGLAQEAEYAYRQSIDLCPDSPEANFRLAQLYITVGNYDEAIKVLEQYQSHDTYNTKIREAINTIKGMQRQILNEQQIEQQYAADSNNLTLAFQLVQFYAARQRHDAMDNVVNSMLPRTDLPPKNLMDIIKIYADLKRLDRVMQLLGVFVQKYPTEPLGWYNLAALQSAQNNCDAAVEGLRRALELDSSGNIRRSLDQDTRFQGCHKDPRYIALLGSGQSSQNLNPLPFNVTR